MEKIGMWTWLDLAETDSTNNAADKLCTETNCPCIVTAKRQTAGRGRRGHSWISDEGNLFMSFAFPAELDNIGQIAVLSGLAVLKTVRAFCPDVSLLLKWPNDVLADGAKISGILFERARNGFWIMGIGINVVSHPETAAAGYRTAGLNALGAATDRLKVLHKFVAIWDEMIFYWKQEGFNAFKRQWLDNAYNLGKTIIVKQGDKEISGILSGLNDDGSLQLEIAGKMHKILAGDVFALKEE